MGAASDAGALDGAVVDGAVFWAETRSVTTSVITKPQQKIAKHRSVYVMEIRGSFLSPEHTKKPV